MAAYIPISIIWVYGVEMGKVGLESGKIWARHNN